MNKKKEYQYPIWAWIVLGLAYLLLFIEGSYGILFSLIIFFILKPSFTRWALEIKKNPLVPFFIVTVFGLLGYLGYYIYYRQKKKNKI